MKISLIMASFKRPELLMQGLFSLYSQKINNDLEVIVLNDGVPDNTERVCNYYRRFLNIKYIFTGKRNLSGEMKFRVPSFALNIGIKQSKGDVVILSCPEMFHLNNTIDLLAEPLATNKKILSIPKFLSFDNDGEVVNYLNKTLTIDLPNDLQFESGTPRCAYARKLPFCMGLYKKELLDIGGYDEDFTGWACDDDDLVGRLVENKLTYHQVDAKVIHLYHGKQYNKKDKMEDLAYLHNLNLYKERKGIIVRNKNKEWGLLDES